MLEPAMVARRRQADLQETRDATFMATTTFPTRDDFAELLNKSLGGENEAFEGKVVKGTVTGIENDMAVIDVGLKSEGRVPLREFAAPGQKAEIAVGDTVEVYVDRIANINGEASLSRARARREAAWDKLEAEHNAGNRVDGVIFGRVKGGHARRVGLEQIVQGSFHHRALRPQRCQLGVGIARRRAERLI